MSNRRAVKGPYDRLQPYNEAGHLQVVIETPRGCRNKFKFDTALQVFRLNSVLPAGTVFPYDFGYVPGTVAEDGDPVDVLLLMDQPAFTGCVVEARLIGVLEAEADDGGSKKRNDRLIAVARDAHDYNDVKSLNDMNSNLLQEIQHFFVSYSEMKSKRFKVLSIRGRRKAKRLVESLLSNPRQRRRK